MTVEQALADYAVMITELKKELGAQTCPVIVFGGRWGHSELYIYPSSPDRQTHTHTHINKYPLYQLAALYFIVIKLIKYHI